jgi:hypothetical protein
MPTEKLEYSQAALQFTCISRQKDQGSDPFSADEVDLHGISASITMGTCVGSLLSTGA